MIPHLRSSMAARRGSHRWLPFLVVGALFVVLVLSFGAAGYLLEFVLRREKEDDLERRLASVGATLLLASLEGRPDLFQVFAEAYVEDYSASLGGEALLPLFTADDVAFDRDEFERTLARLLPPSGLRSAALITSRGTVIAAAGDDALLAGTRPFLLEIDRAEIDAALASGSPAATIAYDVDTVPHKRLYLPLAAALVGASPSAALPAATATLAPAPTAPAPASLPLLLRLEAPASFFLALDALRQRVVGALAIVAGLLVAVAASTLILMRRLERSTRQLAREDRLRSLGTLASGLAHELRNPLGIMRLSLEGLADDLDRRPPARDLAPIARESLGEIDRLNRLIRDVLSFARGETVSGEGSCALQPAIHACVTWLRKAIPHDWEVASNHDDPAWAALEVRIGEDALRQILLNLLRNAVDALDAAQRAAEQTGGGPGPAAVSRHSQAHDHAPAGPAGAADHAPPVAAEPPPARTRRHAPPAIRVRVERPADGSPADHVRVHVSDNGPGVPRAMRQAIFEPFFSQRGEGTGLGLPISRRLAESIGGRLRLEPSDELRGAHFVLSLPLVPPCPGSSAPGA